VGGKEEETGIANQQTGKTIKWELAKLAFTQNLPVPASKSKRGRRPEKGETKEKKSTIGKKDSELNRDQVSQCAERPAKGWGGHLRTNPKRSIGSLKAEHVCSGKNGWEGKRIHIIQKNTEAGRDRVRAPSRRSTRGGCGKLKKKCIGRRGQAGVKRRGNPPKEKSAKGKRENVEGKKELKNRGILRSKELFKRGKCRRGFEGGRRGGSMGVKGSIEGVNRGLGR